MTDVWAAKINLTLPNGTAETLFLGDGAVLPLPHDDPDYPNQAIRQRLDGPPSYATGVSADLASLTGDVGAGQLRLFNGDGALSYLAGCAIGAIEVRRGTDGLWWRDWSPVMRGRGEAAQPSLSRQQARRLTLDLYDLRASLDDAVETRVYGGTNVAATGYDGTAENGKGNTVPLCLGDPPLVAPDMAGHPGRGRRRRDAERRRPLVGRVEAFGDHRMTTRPTTEIDRAKDGYWNSDPVSPTNPGGMDESADGTLAGHVDNFPAAVQAVGLMTQWAGEQADLAGGASSTAVGARDAAVAAAAVAAAAGSDAVWCGLAGGTANDVVVTPGIGVPGLYDGLTLRFVASTPNTGAATFKAGALPIKPLRDQRGMALTANTLSTDLVTTVSYIAAASHWRLSGCAGAATLTGAINEAGITLASASTVAIGAAGGNYITITGTSPITAFDAAQAGTERVLKFSGALTLTHNATSLILPGSANITTAAGDVAVVRSEGGVNWRCTHFSPAAGLPLLRSGGSMAGNPISSATLFDTRYTRVDRGTVSSGTVTFDVSAASWQRLQIGGALTIALSSWPSGVGAVLLLEIVNGGSASITWPTISFVKSDGTTQASPTRTLQSSGTDFVQLWRNGTTVYGKMI